MSCEECEAAREIDDEVPPCESGGGCLIPPLSPDAERLVELRQKLNKMRDYLSAETILRTFDATVDEVEMLAGVDRELARIEDEGKGK